MPGFPTPFNDEARPLDARSRHLRRMVVGAFVAARRGHVGSAFSLIEILRVLYDDILLCDPARPDWAGRDRCILSKGHGCLALYALLADKGFFDAGELLDFCAADGMLGGHPEASKIPGVEASTGALGHGLSIGVGMALAARMDGAAHRVFVIMGDGEIDEGSVWEAAMCAAKHGLEKLVTLIDYNKHQSYGPTKIVQDLEPLADKWRAFGFSVVETDGHDVEALRALLRSLPLDSGKPGAVICHTVKGKGVGFIENNMTWHHKSRASPEEVRALYEALETGR